MFRLLLWQPLLWIWASPGSLLGIVVGGIGLLSGGRIQVRDRTLEFHGAFVTWFLRRPARGAGAMTLGHIILGQNATTLDQARDHELVHVRQYELWGPLFLPAYGLCAVWLHLSGKHGYWDNPFEREAYAHSSPGHSQRSLNEHEGDSSC